MCSNFRYKEKEKSSENIPNNKRSSVNLMKRIYQQQVNSAVAVTNDDKYKKLELQKCVQIQACAGNHNNGIVPFYFVLILSIVTLLPVVSPCFRSLVIVSPFIIYSPLILKIQIRVRSAYTLSKIVPRPSKVVLMVSLLSPKYVKNGKKLH